jgi:hypothetical protein
MIAVNTARPQSATQSGTGTRDRATEGTAESAKKRATKKPSRDLVAAAALSCLEIISIQNSPYRKTDGNEPYAASTPLRNLGHYSPTASASPPGAKPLLAVTTGAERLA